MDIYKRLLFSLIGVAITVITSLGVVSYYITLDAATAKEIELLTHLTEAHASKLSMSLPGDAEMLAAELELSAPHDHVMALIDSAGQTVAGPSLDDLFKIHRLPFNAKEVAEASTHHGHLDGPDEYLIWASARIPGTPFQLFSAHRTNSHFSTFFQKIGLELLAAAFSILILAIWGAIFHSKLIAQRLGQQHAQWNYQAEHDKLTGLANREHLLQRISQLTRNSATPCPPLALLVMDLDRFKEVNDTLGHNVGDEVLKQVAVHLQQALPQAEVIARLGGDEFALLLAGAELHAAVSATQQVQVALTPVVKVKDIQINMQASIGVALFPAHGEDPNVLIRCAEVAMYNAKQNGLSHVIYAQDLDPYNMRRLMLMSDLRRAIPEQQLVLFYQPKVDLRTDRTVGVEALLRWKHPTQGFIAPNDFIPLAEQSDLIRPLTYWVIDEALLQCRAWRQMGIQLDVAVNLSARNLHDPGLPAKVAGLLAKWSIPPVQLTLEITENAIMIDPDRALRILERLHNMGIKLSIDDFGTGYSSLVYLKKLPVTQIKIDRSFVMDMIKDENDAIIVRSTIDLGHNLGCQIVAEGVESKEILQHLKALNCDYGQGYYLSRPVPSDELISWLSQSNRDKGSKPIGLAARQ